MFKSSASGLYWLWLSLAIVLLDVVTKTLALSNLVLHDHVPVLPFFNLTLVYNYGAAFSILSHEGGWQRWFLSLVAILISVMIVLWLRKAETMPLAHKVGLSLVLGGALGNLIDRLRYGYVIDFLDFHWNFSHFPAFNVADAAITTGAVLLLMTLWQKK